ncbi:MAG: helix-turn-helix domain containing protein [Reichenbachiella sp.]
MKRQDISLMRQRYANWHQSGMSKKAYAEHIGIPASTFYYWISKFNYESDHSLTSGFQKIDLIEEHSPQITAILRFPGGVSIEWQGAASSVSFLKTLL